MSDDPNRFQLKLKHQITVLVTLALLVPALLITSIAIYKIKGKADSDIEEYRLEEFRKLKLYLKHITDIGYGVIEVEHARLKDAQQDLNRDSLMGNCLSLLSQVRFDKGEGYFWVTDNKLPFPTMLMHAEKTNLKGVVLSDAKYNVEKGKGGNIYQVRAELANAEGDAFVEYTMKKPGSDSAVNKISYSRLYKPLGWIISTGFYTDQIEKSVALKKEALHNQINNIILSIIGLGILVLILGIYVSNHFSNKLSRAINLIKLKLSELAEGKQVEEVKTNRADEVGEMTLSLNQLVNGLKAYTSFAKEIGKGNFDESFHLLSSQDVLGRELLVMKENLKISESEKQLREWTNEGLAKLGDVLRKNNSNTKQLCNELLKELISYLAINQGAVFVILDKDKEELEMVASYAYNKQKHKSKTIDFGNGLVGQCVLEKQTIYLKEIPDNYIQITSGLGDALPTTLILLPLIYNDEVYGVIELASFKHLESHHITFLEKIAESVASTISSVQVNENTKILLGKSQQMQEELRSQEEEMRQNMEELSATQEQLNRQANEAKQALLETQLREKALLAGNLVMEYTKEGIIDMVSDQLCSLSKYEKADLVGKSKDILRHPDMQMHLYEIQDQEAAKGLSFKSVLKVRTKDNGYFWAEVTTMPVLNEAERLKKVISTLYVLTEADIAQQLYDRQVTKLALN